MQIVYAPCPVTSAGGWRWPDEAVDLPGIGTSIDAGQPLCTVRGHYRSAGEARAGLQGLCRQVLAHLQPGSFHSLAPENLGHEVAH